MTRGRLYALAAGATFATLAIFSKLFYEHGGRPFELLMIRFGGVAVCLWIWVLIRRRPRPDTRSLLFALALGLFQIGASLALLVGFDKAPVGLVALLFYVYPMIVVILAHFVYREDLGARRLAALALGLGGIVLTVGTPSDVATVGIVLGILAGVSTAGYILGSRFAMSTNLQSVELTALMVTLPAIAFALSIPLHGWRSPPLDALPFGLALVITGTLIPISLFYAAVKLIGPGMASLLATVEPLTVVLLGYVVLDESLTALQLVGGALIVLSVATLSWPGRRPAAQPA